MRRSAALAFVFLAAACGLQPATPPDPAHFTVSVTVLSKKCFGSSGCVLTYQTEPNYSGPPINGQWTVTYEVFGGRDVAIDSFEVRGDEWRAGRRQVIRTNSAAAVLSARVTGVL